MELLSWTNVFWYFIFYGVLTFLVMRFMPNEKRKKILTYTIQGTFIEKSLSAISIISRYVMIAASLFLPLSDNLYFEVIGNAMYFIGLLLSTLAMWQFSKEKYDKPITTGLYRISRNPMQVMGSIMCIGIAFIANDPLFWILTIVNTISAYPMFMMQERYCIEKYGTEYKDYMNRTPRVLLIKSRSAK